MLVGAVPRPTPGSGAHAAGPAGGKGGSSSRDAGRFALSWRGAASVSRAVFASRKGASDDQAEILQAPRAREDGEDGRELHGSSGRAAGGRGAEGGGRAAARHLRRADPAEDR